MIVISSRFFEQSEVGGRGDWKRPFPDGSRARAANYCRNPTGDPTGAWCYVDAVETDLCDVPGCGPAGVDSEVLLVAADADAVHWMYVLPEWRQLSHGLRVGLKLWEPGVRAGVSVHLRRSDDPRSPRDTVQVGADLGEKVRLIREGAAAAEEFAYPHLLQASRWREFRFALDDGDPAAKTIVMSSADTGGEMFRWNSAGRVVLVGLSGFGQGHVGARFPSEGTSVRISTSETFVF